MDKVITTALLVIASIIAALALINAVVPAVSQSSSALVTANAAASDRIRTDIEIVHAYGNATTEKIVVWVKNIGTAKIAPIESTDVFLTTPTTVKRIPHGSGTEYWTYTIENGTAWTQTVTIKITLNMTDVTTGVHSVIITVPNAVSAQKEFSV